MSRSEVPRPAEDDRSELYRYVERRGAVDAETAREQLGFGFDRFHDALSALVRRGHLVERGGTIRLALDAGDGPRTSVADTDYAVRPATQEDLSGILKVVSHVAESDGYVVADSIARALRYEDAVTRNGDARSRVFFVAVDDGSVVGWTHLETAPTGATRHTARQTVGVLEPYRGYGIGSALLERGLAWAADNGRLKVYNSLPATNTAALRFLEDHGWETEAVRRDHYVIDGDLVDEVMMAVYPDESATV